MPSADHARVRSRPRLSVFLTPNQPTPGARLLARVVLHSRSPTPVDFVDIGLTGVERRYSHTSSDGKVTRSVYKTHTLVNLALRTEPTFLEVGESEYKAAFDLPRELPPSHVDDVGSVRYRLRVHVSVPWWPDRREEYELIVRPPPWRAPPAEPRVFATRTDGPKADEPYLELSLDSTSAALGARVSGAVSQLSKRPAKSFHVALVAINTARFRPHSHEVRRYEYALPRIPGHAGDATPFAIKLPETETPSFHGNLMKLDWVLTATANYGWGRSTSLSAPLLVAPIADPADALGAPRHVPPVGHARRAKIWAHVAAERGLACDRDSETMTGSFSGVTVRIKLEQRDDGLFSVAELGWPDLGIDLAVREKRWTDAVRAKAVIDDHRFFISCREPAQIKPLLGDSKGARRFARALLSFSEVTLDDDGAMLSAPGGGHRLDNLDEFVSSVVTIATFVGKTAGALPVPESARGWAPAWEDFAKVRDGRFVPGSVSVLGASWEGARINVSTEWEGTQPVHTQIWHALDPELDLTTEPRQSRLASALAKGITLRPDRTLVWRKAGLVSSPPDLEGPLTELATLARALASGDQRGPYR